MFENLLNCFTPLATAYNTLVVVKSAFQQFDVNKHCSSKETHQTERAQNAFAYNPYAGVHQEDLFTSNSEDDFNLVTLKMENDVDTDYCLVETQSGNSSAAATALEDGAPAAGFSAEASPAFYVSLIDSAYDVASAAEKSGSIQPDLKGLVVDIGLNIAMNTTNPATYTSTSDPSRTKTNRFDTDIGIEFDVNSDLNSYPAQNDSNGYGANIGVAIGLNYTPSTTDLPSETAQSHAKGFGADLDIDFGLNTTASAPGQPEKKHNNTGLKSGPAQNDSNGYGANIGMIIGLNYTSSTTLLPSETAQSRVKGFGADFNINFGLNTMAFAPVQHKKRRFGADFDIKFGFSTTVSTPAISSTSAQLKTRRVGANLALKFGFTTFKEYFKFKNNAANNYSTTDYSADLIDDTWNLVERDSALHFESS